MPNKRSVLKPYRLSRKEIQEIREKARQGPLELRRLAAEAKARQEAEAAAREQLIVNAAFEAEAARRLERIDASSGRRTAVMTDWLKNKTDTCPLPSGTFEVGSSDGTAKPLDSFSLEIY